MKQNEFLKCIWLPWSKYIFNFYSNHCKNKPQLLFIFLRKISCDIFMSAQHTSCIVLQNCHFHGDVQCHHTITVYICMYKGTFGNMDPGMHLFPSEVQVFTLPLLRH